MAFDPDTHHRRSIRLKGYDYARAGAYFVTICVHGKQRLFGEFVDGEMRLNEAGGMVKNTWNELPVRFPHVSLDEFVIMPNHVHGIVFLHTVSNIHGRGESRIRPNLPQRQNQGDHKDRPYGTMDNSIGRIVQAFKSLSTNAYIRGVLENRCPPFPGRLWQRNYCERIIRNDDEMCRAREYIRENPMRWDMDEENPEGTP